MAKQHSSDSVLPHISRPELTQVSRIHSTLKPSTGGTTHRKILTSKDRREICLYREEHKTAKQKDIAGNVDLRTHVRIPECKSKLIKFEQHDLEWKGGKARITLRKYI